MPERTILFYSQRLSRLLNHWRKSSIFQVAMKYRNCKTSTVMLPQRIGWVIGWLMQTNRSCKKGFPVDKWLIIDVPGDGQEQSTIWDF